eukprot:2968469-Rhodomonas_salina.1
MNLTFKALLGYPGYAEVHFRSLAESMGLCIGYEVPAPGKGLLQTETVAVPGVPYPGTRVQGIPAAPGGIRCARSLQIPMSTVTTPPQ